MSLDGHADGIPNGAGDVARGGSGRDHAFGREVRPEELATQGYLAVRSQRDGHLPARLGHGHCGIIAAEQIGIAGEAAGCHRQYGVGAMDGHGRLDPLPHLKDAEQPSEGNADEDEIGQDVSHGPKVGLTGLGPPANS